MSHKQRRVILCGKSVILGTVGASLASYPDLELVTAAPVPQSEAELEALAPDVILFDVAAGLPEAAFALLQHHPNLLLIGVNPENEQLLRWSSEAGSVLSVEELVQGITRSAGE